MPAFYVNYRSLRESQSPEPLKCFGNPSRIWRTCSCIDHELQELQEREINIEKLAPFSLGTPGGEGLGMRGHWLRDPN